MTNNCSTNRPKYSPHIFIGDFGKQALIRGQSGEKISCSDPKFDTYRCMSSYDLRKMYELFVIGCESFSEPDTSASLQDATKLFEKDGE